MKYSLYIFLLLFILTTSCERVFDFPDKGKYIKCPVIEALLTNQQGYQKVRVSFSTRFEDSLASEAIDDAIVKIADNHGDTTLFESKGNGWYTNQDLVAVPNILYTLIVQVDTTIYKATSQMIPAHGLDSVSYAYQKLGSNTQPAYYVYIYAGATIPDNPRYYQVRFNTNHDPLSYNPNMALLSDLETLSLNGIPLSFDFSAYNTLDVELYSINKVVYDYFSYIEDELLFNTSSDLEFKTNPPIQFTPKALGYFQVSDLSSKTLIIE